MLDHERNTQDLEDHEIEELVSVLTQLSQRYFARMDIKQRIRTVVNNKLKPKEESSE